MTTYGSTGRESEWVDRLNSQHFALSTEVMGFIVHAMQKGQGRLAVAVCTILAVLGGWVVQGEAAPIAYSRTPIAGWSTNGIVKSVLIIGDTAYAGGTFTQVQAPGGSPTLARTNLAAFDIHTGAIRTGFTASTNGRVESMATDGTQLFIGGDFTTVNNVSRVRLAALDPNTGSVNLAFSAGATSHVYALRAKGSRLYVGGSFSTLGGVPRGRIGAVDPTTGAVDPTFNPGADDAVHGIVTSPDGNTVYVGGDFRNIGGGARGWLAPLSATTGQLLPLAFQYPVITGSIPGVIDLDISPAGDRLFGALGGFENRVSSWSTTTGQNQWFYQVDGDTQAVRSNNGNVYFGFHEGALDDHTIRMRSADASTGQINNFYTPMDSFFGVWDIDANADALVVGGEFTNFSGVATQGIAILPKASNDTTPPTAPGNLTVTGSAATSISMSWSAGTDNNGVAGYRILRNGVEVAYPTGLTYTDGDLTPQTSYTYTVQTIDAAGNFSPSSSAVIGTTGVVLTSAGSVWKYLDNGTNQGTAWRASAFNDATWAAGPAQLGYGDGDEATVVSYGPDVNRKYLTTYFRRQFEVANPASVGGLTLRLLRDDGAVVYRQRHRSRPLEHAGRDDHVHDQREHQHRGRGRDRLERLHRQSRAADRRHEHHRRRDPPAMGGQLRHQLRPRPRDGRGQRRASDRHAPVTREQQLRQDRVHELLGCVHQRGREREPQRHRSESGDVHRDVRLGPVERVARPGRRRLRRERCSDSGPEHRDQRDEQLRGRRHPSGGHRQPADQRRRDLQFERDLRRRVHDR